jgi:hypothetical protein
MLWGMRGLTIIQLALATGGLATGGLAFGLAVQTQPSQPPAEALPGDALDGLFDDAPSPLLPAIDTPTDRARFDQGPAVAPGVPRAELLREGTFVIDRVGRIERGDGGSLPEFLFEADGRSLADPPLIVLPNLKLMEIENALDAVAADMKFRITGRITEYRGRNYVLLEKVVVVR